jgi:chemotaxis protein CheX
MIMAGPATVEIAKPFIQATINVLSTMAGITPTPGAPYVKKDDMAHGDVSAIIGITGDKAGSISVSFTKPCAVGLVRGMIGDDIQDIVQDTKDAVGEIANMISGQARSGLGDLGMHFQGSTPSVVMGDHHSISHMTKGPVVAIPFTSGVGEFTVEFGFDA